MAWVGEQRGWTHVLLNEVQAAIVWHKGCDLLSVLDQLYTRALADGRVGLLCLNSTVQHRQVRISQLLRTTMIPETPGLIRCGSHKVSSEQGVQPPAQPTDLT